jgi:xanthine/CO dehydrogenase XdhC/CoxF family maturation factor
MHQIAAIVDNWQHQQRVGAVARVIAAEGLGPQHRDEMQLIDGNWRSGGTLLGGAVEPEVASAAKHLLARGRNPAETAVSIIAEIIATRSGRAGTPLTTTTGRING